MTTTPSTTPTPSAKPADKGYIVLGKVDGPAWAMVQVDAKAKSAATAIRNVVGNLADEEQSGTYVAIPLRSWKPVNVTAKVETTLVVEDAS